MKNTLKSAKSTSPSKSVISVTLSQFRTEYLKADEFCQEVQSFWDEAGIPALNELRNAGKHFLCSLDDIGAVTEESELIAAINHARRAAYEAYEAGILFALEIIAKFKEDYETIPVEGAVPDYTGLLKKANAAKKSIEAGRQNGFDRTSDHTARMAAFRELRECAETLEIAREEMNKKVDAAGFSRKALWVAIIGIVVSLTGLVWQAADFWPLNAESSTITAKPSPTSVPVNPAIDGPKNRK